MSKWLEGISGQQLSQLYEEKKILDEASIEFCELWRSHVFHFRRKRDPELRRLATEKELNFLKSLEKIIKGETRYHEERRKTVLEMKKLLKPLYTDLEEGRLPYDAKWIIHKFLVHSKLDSLNYGLGLLLTDGRIFEIQKDYPIFLGEIEKNYHRFMEDQQAVEGKTYPEAKRLVSFLYIHTANPSFFKDIVEEPLILYGDDFESWKVYLDARGDLIRKLGHDLRIINPKYRRYFPRGVCWRHLLREPVKDKIPMILQKFPNYTHN